MWNFVISHHVERKKKEKKRQVVFQAFPFRGTVRILVKIAKSSGLWENQADKYIMTIVSHTVINITSQASNSTLLFLLMVSLTAVS